MNYHTFQTHTYVWPDVVPGDIVISPETVFYRMSDFVGRHRKTRVVITKFKPMLVIARLDHSVDDVPISENASTFIVFSLSQGFLVSVRGRFGEFYGELGA